MKVVGDRNNIKSIDNSQCKRGEEYARSEYLFPLRTLTSTIKVINGTDPVVSIRSDKPIPKAKIMACMEIIKMIEIKAPINRYDILIHDIAGTGVDIVATTSIKSI